MRARRIGTVASYFLSYNLYAFGSGLVGVFLNLFFLSNYSFSAVLYFQITTYAAELTAYLLSSYLLSSYLLPRWRPKYLYVLGLALSAFVLADMLAASRVISNAFIFGALWGTASGVFWAGNNPMTQDITRNANRTSFVSTNNILNGIVTLVAPVTAGVLIQFSEFPGVLRYFWDFTLTAVLLVLSAIVILRTHGETDRPIRDLSDRARRRPGREFARFRAYFVAWQIFAIPIGILVPIYVFQVTGSYVVTGFFASYTILISIAANFGWRNGFRQGSRFPIWAVIAIIASSGLLLLRWDPPLDAFAFMGIYTLFSTPLNNKVMVNFMNLIDRDGDLDRVRVWADREFYLGVGRAIALTGTIIVSTFFIRNSIDLVLTLPVLTLFAVSYLAVLGPRSSAGPGPQLPRGGAAAPGR